MKYYDRVRNNVYSQNGEDGVLNVLMQELEIKPSTLWCVDVGAYDGISYSNVRRLIDEGAHAVMIEPSIVGGIGEPKFEDLQNLPKQFPNVIALNYAVIPSFYTEEEKKRMINGIEDNDIKYGKERKEKLEGMEIDEILIKTEIPEDYDILNIDTDTCDHFIWKDHKKYKPKIIIIEIESSIPPDSTKEVGGMFSFSQSLALAKEKEYSLVCHTGNMIYVRDDLVDRLSIPQELINSVELFNRSWL
tara:strand:- start:6221 stop:6958 length:738 start_codon:yes stop_codon:yes gene_type:complete